VVSSHLKNISQDGKLPQIELKMKQIFETTTQILSPMFMDVEHDLLILEIHPCFISILVGGRAGGFP